MPDANDQDYERRISDLVDYPIVSYSGSIQWPFACEFLAPVRPGIDCERPYPFVYPDQDITGQLAEITASRACNLNSVSAHDSVSKSEVPSDILIRQGITRLGQSCLRRLEVIAKFDVIQPWLSKAAKRTS